MSDLISRSALIEKCKELSAVDWNKRASPISWSHAYEAFVEELEDAPAVDAVEVVRCEGCKMFSDISPYTGAKFDFKYCTKFGNATKETDFCSYGERRADDGRNEAD